MVTCNFTVTVYNLCVQDDGNAATVFLGNSITELIASAVAGRHSPALPK